ncbi:MAG: hypothetical protein A3B70_05550 [Deltaproteobacteria bacterium RIFCSPHIGHO2_02_FULL_40_11]|nr:MAG: hypothetical protein A3B70_05550 [Deltaproteobacteria bacterium RIFCSPHIGHO2_02_FULL_40_11]
MLVNLYQKKYLNFWTYRFFLHACVVVFSSWARVGLSTTDNLIHLKNSLFMHLPTFIEELYHTDQVITSDKLFSRATIEMGEVPLEVFSNPRYAPEELNRMIQHEIEIQEDQHQGLELSKHQKTLIRKQIYGQYANQKDPQVIEGVALTLAEGSSEKIYRLFQNLGNFHTYAPTIFLESHELTPEELRHKNQVQPHNIAFQYARVRIAQVEFTHTLRYEMTREEKTFGEVTLPCFTVAWEIEPELKEDPQFVQKGVVMNNGQFFIQPYVQENGLVDPNRSVILFHIYVRIDPLNVVMETLKNIFIQSEAKNALDELVRALRKQVQ